MSPLSADAVRAAGRFQLMGAQLASLAVVVLGLAAPRVPAARAAGSVLLLVAVSLLGLGAYLRGRHESGPRRILVLGFAVSAAFSIAAQAHNTLRYALSAAEPTFPSPGLLIFLLGSHPALLIALGGALVWRRKSLRSDMVLDILLLTAAAAVVGVQLVEVVPWATSQFSEPTRVLLMLWRSLPIAELCLAIALVVARGRMIGTRTSVGLVLAMLIFAGGNVLHGQLALIDQAAAVTATDVIWALHVICLTVVIGARPVPAEPDSIAEADGPPELLPGALAGDMGSIASRADATLRARFVLVGLVICAQATLVLGFRTERRVALAVAIALFSLLLAWRGVREMLRARRRTDALTGNIAAERALSQILESRVSERTAELAEAQRVLQRMWVLGQHVTQELQPPRVVQRFMEAVMDVAQVDAAALGLVADSRHLRLAAVLGNASHSTGQLLPIDGSAMGAVMRSGRSWHLSDVSKPGDGMPTPLISAISDRSRGHSDVPTAGGLAVIPVQRRGECIGALALASQEPRHWTASELARIEAMTDLLSVALVNAESVESLRQAEWRFRTLFRSAPDAVITLFNGGRIQEANDYAADLFGEPPSRLAGRLLEDFVVSSDRQRLAEALRTGFRGQPTRVDVNVPRGGASRRMEIALRQLPDADPPVVLLIGRDVTTEIEMQARLVETERLAAVGELVAGVAHEVNNPLGSISAFAQLMMREGGLTDDQMESLEIIYGETMRASQVVKDLLAFARRSEPVKGAVDMTHVVERVLRLRAYQLSSHGIRTILELASELPPVAGDARQLQQVVLNLVTNALQAMPDGGELRMTASADAEMVTLEISDTGGGIPQSVRPHIFEPFFTTKEEGEGTGLGLSVSYGIIAAHGGTLALTESSESGSRFVIQLPALQSHEETEDPHSLNARDTGSSPLLGRRILFVDDEAALRRGMEAFGRLRGISVSTAPDGRQALALAEHSSFDAIVCDLRMPAMDGVAFFEALSVRRPELSERTIFITGDMMAGGPVWRRGRQPLIIAKPFTFEQIEDAVWDLMRGMTTSGKATMAASISWRQAPSVPNS